MLAVSAHVDSQNNLSISCTFLGSFQGVGYCEIRLSNVDSTFTYCRRFVASGGRSVLINNVTLNASTVYFYNVSAVLEDEQTPVVVVQGVVSTSPTGETHRSKLGFTLIKQSCRYIDEIYFNVCHCFLPRSCCDQVWSTLTLFPSTLSRIC